MGSGRWDKVTYTSSVTSRKLAGVADFAYSDKARVDDSVPVHPNLDPKRINNKPFGKLESRDSKEHPKSNAIFVGFDVTGSNFQRAVEAQKRLPELMTLLEKYVEDPQVLIAANDDINFVGKRAIQISDYESDIRIDDHIRNVILVGQGGGNMGESYDLLLYAAARKTVLDCFEKRKRKGYLFLYADEPLFGQVRREEVKEIFGDAMQVDIPIETIIAEARELYHVFMIWPQRGYIEARSQFVKLFGDEYVLTLQDPSLICPLIGSIIGLNEEKISAEDVVTDLMNAGTSEADAQKVVKTLAKLRKIKLPDAEEAGA